MAASKSFSIPEVARVAVTLAALVFGPAGGPAYAGKDSRGERPTSVFVVNSDNDRDDHVCDLVHCSLREAIGAANAVQGAAEIRFALPAHPYRIAMGGALPALRGGLVVDGASQPGSVCPRPRVHLDGAAIRSEQPVNGIEIRGDGTRVRGLAITGFSGHGVLVEGDGNLLQCLFVGVDPDGTQARGNGGHGIAVVDGRSNRVGGPGSMDGNLLSGNAGFGLYLSDAPNTMRAHNGIGVDVFGQPTLANGDLSDAPGERYATGQGGGAAGERPAPVTTAPESRGEAMSAVDAAIRDLQTQAQSNGAAISPLWWLGMRVTGPNNGILEGAFDSNLAFACAYGEVCEWPVAYDLSAQQVLLFWQSTLSQQQIDDIVQENGYEIRLRVNGQLATRGLPAPTGHVGYEVVSMPQTLPEAMKCPADRRCIAIQAGVARLLGPVELEILSAEPRDTPLVVIDGLGRVTTYTQGTVPFAKASKTVEPNSVTGGQHWFTAALFDTFKHPRCATCHGFGTIEAVAQHHADNGTGILGAELEPSALQPGGHVIGCRNCHDGSNGNGSVLPTSYLYNGSLVYHHEIRWIAPAADLDVNWSQKNDAQICTKVRTTLPTEEKRREHFHFDARLQWATDHPLVPFRDYSDPLPSAPPHDFVEFLRRVDVWSLSGAPCPT